MFLRIVLNRKVLEECLKIVLKEDRILTLFYSEHAILNNQDNVRELVSTSSFLSFLSFFLSFFLSPCNAESPSSHLFYLLLLLISSPFPTQAASIIFCMSKKSSHLEHQAHPHLLETLRTPTPTQIQRVRQTRVRVSALGSEPGPGRGVVRSHPRTQPEVGRGWDRGWEPERSNLAQRNRSVLHANDAFFLSYCFQTGRICDGDMC